MTAEDIKNRICQVVEQAEGGHLDPLHATIQLKSLEKVLKDGIAQIQPLAIDEALKHSDKEFDFHGAKVHVRSSATRYSFKHIKEWKEANKTLKDIEANAKESLKLKLKGQNMVSNDGEIIEAADFTPGKETIHIKL